MSKPKVVMISYEIDLPKTQTYDSFCLWINVDGRKNFLQDIYKREEADIFCVMQRGFRIASEDSIENVVKVFEANKQLACILSLETFNGSHSFFIHKDRLPNSEQGFDLWEIQRKDSIKKATVGGIFTINGTP